MKLFFATSNRHKVEEARKVIPNIEMFEFKHNEIRAESLESIALEALAYASERKENVFVEDSGLFIDKFEGFPGQYSSFVFSKIGCRGILKLLDGEENRRAKFVSVIAAKVLGEVRTFKGVCEGRISKSIRGKEGFGFDPIFVPEGEKKTFAERKELKNKLSHRYKSILKLRNFIDQLRC